MSKSNFSVAKQKSLAKARKVALTLKYPCQYCGEYRIKANIIRHEKSCYLNPANIKLCPVCENPIKDYRHATTCGCSCANSYFRSGINHPNHIETGYRTTCFHFHEKKCVICDESNIIEVHHLDENKQNNDPSNLIPLCPTHHQYWHSRHKHLIEDKVLHYIQKWREESE